VTKMEEPVEIERKVLIDAEDYEHLPRRIALHLLEWGKLSYGVKLVSCETGKVITDPEEAIGALLIPLEAVLGLTTSLSSRSASPASCPATPARTLPGTGPARHPR